MTFKKSSSKSLLGALVVAMPISAAAQNPGDFEKAVRQCDKGVQKEILKFRSDLAKRLGKCADLARLEVFKGAKGLPTDFPKRALGCEQQLAKALDLGSVLSGTDKLSKLEAAIDKLMARGTCNVSTIDALGHMLGGATAPPSGGAIEDWLKAKLRVVHSAETLAAVFESSPTTRELLDRLVEDRSPSSLTGFVDCTIPTHPNLCTLYSKTPNAINGLDASTGSLLRMCRVHECNLLGSAQMRLALAGSEAARGIDLAPNPLEASVSFTLCRPEFTPRLGFPKSDFGMFATSPAHVPSQPISLFPTAALCIEIQGWEGWCDCSTGASLPINATQCVDHVPEAGASCPGTSLPNPRSGDETCFCTQSIDTCGRFSLSGEVPCVADVASGPCTSQADCFSGRCGATAAGGRCHAGSTHETNLDLTGHSGTGDCLVEAEMSITPIEISGSRAGVCLSADSSGPDPRVCNPAGGDGCTTCLAIVGPDGLPCTRDDLFTPAPAITVPFTTGVATARLEDAVYTEGTCTGSGVPCIESANCFAGETCNGASVSLLESPVGLGGSSIDCRALASGNWTGSTFVAEFPIPDFPGHGDVIMRMATVCQ